MAEDKVLKNHENRLEYFDILKGIGIIFVIIGHMTRFTSFTNKAIYTFHMPLFFLVSGYFISFKNKYGDFVKKKAKQLLIPYVFTCVCVLIIIVTEQIIKGKSLDIVIKTFFKIIYAGLYGSGMEYFKPFYIPPIGAIWFLLALFISLIVVRKCLEYKYGVVYIFVLAFVGYFTSLFFWMPFSIQAGLTVTIFVYIGYVVKKSEFLEEKINPIIVIAALIIWVLGICFGKGLYLFFNGYGDGFFSIIVGVCATYVILFISKFLSKHLKMIAKILGFYGRNSLIVLFFHLVEYNLFPWKSIFGFSNDKGIYSVFTLIAVFIFKIAFCTLGIFIVHRIKFLSKIFSLRSNY